MSDIVLVKCFREEILAGSIPGVQEIASSIVPSRSIPETQIFHSYYKERLRVFSEKSVKRRTHLNAKLPFGISGLRAQTVSSPQSVRLTMLSMHSQSSGIRDMHGKIDSSVHFFNSDRHAKLPFLIYIPIEVEYSSENQLVRDLAETVIPEAVWTVEEISVFLEKFALYPKEFSKISCFLPEKQTKDCIDFYYRRKYSLGLKNMSYRETKRRQNQELSLGRTQIISEIIQTISLYSCYNGTVPAKIFSGNRFNHPRKKETFFESDEEECRKYMIECLTSYDTTKEALYQNIMRS
jgi:hypothetical protein